MGTISQTHACKPHPAFAKLVDKNALPEAKPGTKKARPAADTKATHLFTGTIITMDATTPKAEAIAIADGVILGVGTKEAVEQFADSATKRVDLGARVMYPGFIEPHAHLWVTAINYDWLDCSAFNNKGFEAIKQRIADAAKAAKPGEWILGKQFDPSLLAGGPVLTTKELDPLAPNNPVLILNASMHFAYVNSKALEVADITKDTPEPQNGTIGTFDDGTPNGVMGEVGGVGLMISKINVINPDVILKNITRVTDDAAHVGVTTIREAGTGGFLGAKEVAILHHLQQQNALKTRVSIALFDDNAKTWPQSPDIQPGVGDDFVWLAARKIVSDGSTQGGSAYLTQPYLNSKDRGKPDVTPEELKERIAWCEQNGWQVMIHANGDAAVDAVVHAYHDVLKTGHKDLRHRVEHCTLVNDDSLFTKMKEVGVSPSFLINHVYFWGKTLRDNVLGKERIHMLDRTAACLQAGIKFTLHSDYNVSPINPLHYVKVAATRTMWDGGEVLGSDQRVPVEAALRAVTIDAAWQILADDRLGSLTPGKCADFVVLERDPQAVEPEKIDQITILQTYRAGELTFEKS